jgi:hypothetical protein
MDIYSSGALRKILLCVSFVAQPMPPSAWTYSILHPAYSIIRSGGPYSPLHRYPARHARHAEEGRGDGAFIYIYPLLMYVALWEPTQSRHNIPLLTLFLLRLLLLHPSPHLPTLSVLIPNLLTGLCSPHLFSTCLRSLKL